MKFFLDANIPHSALEIFKELNLKCEHARDVGLGRADDIEVMNYAIKDNSVLITKDLEFANLMIFPIESHYGVVVVRLPPFFKASQFVNILRDFLQSIDVKDLKNALAIVKVGRYRIKPLGNP